MIFLQRKDWFIMYGIRAYAFDARSVNTSQMVHHHLRIVGNYIGYISTHL